MKAMKSNEVIAKLNERKDRSAWDKAVTAYAVEIVEAMSVDGEQEISRESLPQALNGAATSSRTPAKPGSTFRRAPSRRHGAAS